ncbi:FAD-dependent monooxygenase [Psychromarinibacter sp. C21-152]|uniref:FAD-dependent monooxygenase n=1 Tax=Psychromarinibacter sediminicola TaxID=3033385 RepID=A0AAE3NWD9_9RHOB|nr:FAD-dependent monooxygenase [Psychromarinibacter sediminicola]MDF0602909.1 FAD-dependent monooxygenase [Psychromarinibacter sediminicola]
MSDKNLTRVDIFISGGGLAGLAAAAAFAHAGFSVLLADPSPPPPEDTDGEDLRSTAFLGPSRDLLERTGLWDRLAPHAVRLDALRIVDTEGWPPEIRETRVFQPQELGQETFGWNLPNALTRREMVANLARQPGVELAWGTGFRSLLTRTTEARVTLTDGRRVAARLVIAADGRDSPVREAAGIGATTRRYGQKVFAFNATHPAAHGNVSTEVYNDGGAFTTVPLPDIDGRPASAIVWMNAGPRAAALAAMEPAAFDAEMTARACGLLGPMERTGRLGQWPVVTRTADRLTAERVALVAEAAHVLPPIGAQGLNTSLHDIALLCDLARDAPATLGTAAHLEDYDRRRARDIALRARIIDLYNRICQSGEPPIQALRRAGLRTVHDTPPLRRTVMQAGLGRR